MLHCIFVPFAYCTFVNSFNEKIVLFVYKYLVSIAFVQFLWLSISQACKVRRYTGDKDKLQKWLLTDGRLKNSTPMLYSERLEEYFIANEIDCRQEEGHSTECSWSWKLFTHKFSSSIKIKTKLLITYSSQDSPGASPTYSFCHFPAV